MKLARYNDVNKYNPLKKEVRKYFINNNFQKLIN